MNHPLAKLTPKATIGQILSADEQAGQLLASIGLEPSACKDETLRSVCQQRQWSEVEVLRWVKKNRLAQNAKQAEDKSSDSERPEKPNFAENLIQWCDWLEEEKMKKNISLLNEISGDFPRVHQIHGNQYPWLKDMQWYFEQFEEVFRMYCEFSKKKFYPLAKKLDGGKGEVLDGTVRELVRALNIIEQDQIQLQQHMKSIRKKGRNFENPAGACSTFCILNQNFKMFNSSFKQQHAIEKERIIPLVQKKLNAL